MKKTLFITASILMALALLIYATATYFTKPAKQDLRTNNKIVIGWIGPLSGPVAFLGMNSLKATKLAVLQYDKRRQKTQTEIQLVSADDAYSPDKALAAYYSMVHEKKANIILFCSSHKGLELIGKQLGKDKVAFINVLDNDLYIASLKNKHIYQIAKQTENFSSVIAQHLLAAGVKRVFVLTRQNNIFMDRVLASLQSIFRPTDVTLYRAVYNPDQQNFTPSLSLGQKNNAQAYIFLGYGELKQAMEQARAMGIKAPFYSPNPAAAIDGTYVVHFSFIDGNISLAKAFLKEFKKTYGTLPTPQWVAFQAYDATQIVINASNQALRKPGHFIENFRRTLLATKDFEGVSGYINIRSNGASQGINPSLYIMKQGQLVRASASAQE